MKNLIIFLALALMAIGINSCKKTDDKTDLKATCSNGKLDGDETEIDCGGACDECPPQAVVSCRMGASNFNSSNSNTYGQILGNSLRVNANDGRPMNFMFLFGSVNQPQPIISVSFAYNGEAYTLAPADSGRGTLTSIDTLRRIASGTFHFSAKRVTGPDTTSVREGVFTNIRY